MTATPTIHSREPALDLIRALSIVSVVVFHGVQMSPEALPWLVQFTQVGRYGVDVFFVLSGWLIGRIYWREFIRTGAVNIVRFWLGRWLRTIPPYLVALGLSWLAVRLARDEPFDFGYLVFAQNFYQQMPFFLVSWSLCIEEHFYIFAPVALRLANTTSRGPFILLLVILLGAACGRCVISADGVDPAFGFATTATFLRSEGLALGFAAAWACESKSAAWAKLERWSGGIACICALLLTGSWWVPGVWMYRLGLTVLPVGIVGALVWSRQVTLPSILRHRFVHAVALSTYSIYLTHALMLHVARQVCASVPALPWQAYFPIALTLISVAAWVFYKCVEEPSIRIRTFVLAR